MRLGRAPFKLGLRGKRKILDPRYASERNNLWIFTARKS